MAGLAAAPHRMGLLSYTKPKPDFIRRLSLALGDIPHLPFPIPDAQFSLPGALAGDMQYRASDQLYVAPGRPGSDIGQVQRETLMQRMGEVEGSGVFVRTHVLLG